MLMSPIRVVWVLTIVLCVAYGDKILGKKSQVANFLAGGLAGTVSSTITIPLEVVKTQLQSSRIAGKSSVLQVTKTVYRTEGIKGFFRGLTPLLIGIIPTRALYFWAYTTSKSRLTGPLGEGSPVNHLLSAFAAGITSNTV